MTAAAADVDIERTVDYLLAAAPSVVRLSAEANAMVMLTIAEMTGLHHDPPMSVAVTDREPLETATQVIACLRYAFPDVQEVAPTAGLALRWAIDILQRGQGPHVIHTTADDAR